MATITHFHHKQKTFKNTSKLSSVPISSKIFLQILLSHISSNWSGFPTKLLKMAPQWAPSKGNCTASTSETKRNGPRRVRLSTLQNISSPYAHSLPSTALCGSVQTHHGTFTHRHAPESNPQPSLSTNSSFRSPSLCPRHSETQLESWPYARGDAGDNSCLCGCYCIIVEYSLCAMVTVAF